MSSDLEHRVRMLEAAIRNLPARQSRQPTSFVPIQIGAGNILEASYSPQILGLVGLTSGGITEVPSSAPSNSQWNSATTLPDGLGTGFIQSQNRYVWVASRVILSSVTYQDFAQAIEQTAFIISRVVLAVPITGGGSATAEVHLPWLGGQ